jgi:hypothetical protein
MPAGIFRSMPTSTLAELLIAAALFLGMVSAAEVGYRIGVRRRRDREADSNHAAVLGAVLGLLALLLGFAFAGATSRFIERQGIIVSEANAIGTAALRADLLPANTRSDMRSGLRAYTQDRLALFHATRTDASVEIEKRLAEHHARLWRIAVTAVKDNPALTNMILPPLNESIDLLTARDAASHKHLPIPVLFLLTSCALVAMFSVGQAQGLVGSHRRSTVFALAFLVAGALWITIDLDYPRRGLIRMTAAPLEAALDALSHDVPK